MILLLGFPGGSAVKNPPAMQELQETQVRSPGLDDPLEEGMTTSSSILAWRIPCTEALGGLQSMESQVGGHNWSSLTQAEAQIQINVFLLQYMLIWILKKKIYPI